MYSPHYLGLFHSKIDKSSDHWMWAASTSRGYGQFTVTTSMGRKTVKAHRVMYELAYGPIPQGLHVLHKCDIPLCVTPSCLYLGTNSQNVSDKINRGRQKRGEQISTAKLTDDRVRAIKASKLNQQELARLNGVSQSMISLIKCGKKWRHIA